MNSNYDSRQEAKSKSYSYSESSSSTLPPSPDGGWGWVVVISSFFIHFIIDGIPASFGILHIYFLQYFKESQVKVDLVLSLYFAVPLILGPFASSIVDYYDCRTTTIFASILSFLGFFLSFFAQSIEILWLTIGLMAGIGLSIIYVAAIVSVSYYFDTKRAFVTGIATSGSGFGTIFFGLLTQKLIDQFNWRGTIFVFALSLLLISPLALVFRPVKWPESLYLQREAKKYLQKLYNFKEINKNQEGTISLLTGETINLRNPSDWAESKERTHSLLEIPRYLVNNPIISNEVYETIHKDYNVDTIRYTLPVWRSIFYKDSSMNISRPNSFPSSMNKTNFPQLISKPHQSDLPYQKWQKHIEKLKASERFRFLRINRSSVLSYFAPSETTMYNVRSSSCPDINFVVIPPDVSKSKSPLLYIRKKFKSMFHFSLLKDKIFLLIFISNFMLSTWDDIPYIYSIDHARNRGIPIAQTNLLIPLLGIACTIGQIFFGYIITKFKLNVILIYTLSVFICGLALIAFPFLQTFYQMCIYAVTFGFFISPNYTLTSVILIEILGIEKLTQSYGLVLSAQGIGSILGPPIAGCINDFTKDYNLTFFIAGSFMCLSAIVFLCEPKCCQYILNFFFNKPQAHCLPVKINGKNNNLNTL